MWKIEQDYYQLSILGLLIKLLVAVAVCGLSVPLPFMKGRNAGAMHGGELSYLYEICLAAKKVHYNYTLSKDKDKNLNLLL